MSPPRLASTRATTRSLVRPAAEPHQASTNDRGYATAKTPDDRQVPASRPSRRGASGLDDHALDSHLNVAAAVGKDLRYVQVRQGDEVYWLGRGR